MITYSDAYYINLKIATEIFGIDNIKPIGGGQDKITKQILDPHILIKQNGKMWSLDFKRTHFIDLFTYAQKDNIIFHTVQTIDEMFDIVYNYVKDKLK